MTKISAIGFLGLAAIGLAGCSSERHDFSQGDRVDSWVKMDLQDRCRVIVVPYYGTASMGAFTAHIDGCQPTGGQP